MIWFHPTTLDELKARMASRPGLPAHLGIEFTEIGPDFLSGRMPVDERTHQPYGLLHGGASCVLAETLGSVAGGLVIDRQTSRVVGLEINANHVKAVSRGFVVGTARPLHLGQSTHVWDIRIEVPESRALVCISRLTLAVVRAK